jgi:hypothetical protein
LSNPSAYDEAGRTISPRSFALPPVGVARVAPHTEQFTVVDGRLKIVCSPEQSGHFTTQKGAGSRIRSSRVLLDQLEGARPPARGLDDVLTLAATELQIHATHGFGTPLGLGSRKAPVAARGPSKSTLPPLELRRWPLLSLLHVVRRMPFAFGAIRGNGLGVVHRRPRRRAVYIGLPGKLGLLTPRLVCDPSDPAPTVATLRFHLSSRLQL